MKKNQLCAYITLAALCVLLPFSLLLYLFFLPAIPADLGSYTVAVVDPPEGDAQTCAAGTPLFLQLSDAFVKAQPVNELPSYCATRLYDTVKWERGGRVLSYRLYLSPAPLAGYLIDAQDRVFRLQEQDALLLLQQEAFSSALMGKLPPTLTFGGQEVPFSLCRWQYEMPDGTVLLSREYQNVAATAVDLQFSDLPARFSEMPESTVYTVYHGADEILSVEEPDSLTALLPGSYQVVLVSVWQQDSAELRAAYSFQLFVANNNYP